jgi:glycosyltransferase involved in cell wall biosynthesis
MTTENKSPLVSVICLCYNHSSFVKESIVSVLEQSYPNIELIVVDDKSTDNSVTMIKDILKDHPEVKFIEHSKNTGNCTAFNDGWRMSTGEFVIDLAADDTLPENRIENGVKEFSQRDTTYGVQYGDVAVMNEDGTFIDRHSKTSQPVEGNIYTELVKRYFVSSASMMIRQEVLKNLNGYDETLAYEDFDFWIRSSRIYKFFYTPEVLVNKRLVKGSMSDRQFRRGSPQQLSTYRVCEKILLLNKTPEEHRALEERLWYEIRVSLRLFDVSLAIRYIRLLRETSRGS